MGNALSHFTDILSEKDTWSAAPLQGPLPCLTAVPAASSPVLYPCIYCPANVQTIGGTWRKFLPCAMCTAGSGRCCAVTHQSPLIGPHRGLLSIHESSKTRR
ncbi:hypothetical protein GSI_08021 [Ganoderma sinense ZZ0214-1]|uniref:Uncharacterized protein n=1 Tax=Ganoderma sinense ZZ0214-1 TaxID=1077348 RepID=A0A2G8S7U4_9APHY|nr:hypothetical protein GSI_08021 [Ganoderma sinense ZZ0214-1]